MRRASPKYHSGCGSAANSFVSEVPKSGYVNIIYFSISYGLYLCLRK